MHSVARAVWDTSSVKDAEAERLEWLAWALGDGQGPLRTDDDPPWWASVVRECRSSAREALISIHPEHVGNILSGSKTVEIRRRRPNLSPGDRLWIYSTKPHARVEVVARLGRIDTDSRTAIWDRFGDRTAISMAEYEAYTEGAAKITALGIAEVREVPALTLGQLRDLQPGFQPPQFWACLAGSAILEELRQRGSLSI